MRTCVLANGSSQPVAFLWEAAGATNTFNLSPQSQFYGFPLLATNLYVMGTNSYYHVDLETDGWLNGASILVSDFPSDPSGIGVDVIAGPALVERFMMGFGFAVVIGLTIWGVKMLGPSQPSLADL